MPAVQKAKSFTGGLGAALSEHRAAVEAFAATAAKLPVETWHRPVGEGKWSPAQITEHLALALEAVHRNLEQGSGMTFSLPAWKRFVLRRRILPRLLATGRFPPNVRAPREIRPSPSTASREDALGRLRRAWTEVEAACARDLLSGSRKLDHPYFGALAAPKFFRLLAWHTLHHRSQLPQSDRPPQ